MAIAGFKHRIFKEPKQLADFVASSVTTVHAIIYDNNGMYILFYV